jgi:hypothetical protein
MKWAFLCDGYFDNVLCQDLCNSMCFPINPSDVGQKEFCVCVCVGGGGEYVGGVSVCGGE